MFCCICVVWLLIKWGVLALIVLGGVVDFNTLVTLGLFVELRCGCVGFCGLIYVILVVI